jgi:protein disulfide-isomerase A6
LAKAYESEENIVIASVDADKHRSLGERFDVKGFPTLKWFGKGNKNAPEDFNRGSEEEMLSAINSKTGAQRDISGKLGSKAGTVEALSSLTKKFKGSDQATKKNLIQQAKDYVKGLSGATKANGEWYVKLMQKTLDAGDSFVEKESARLSRMIEGGQASAQFLDSFQIRKNILGEF